MVYRFYFKKQRVLFSIREGKLGNMVRALQPWKIERVA